MLHVIGKVLADPRQVQAIEPLVIEVFDLHDHLSRRTVASCACAPAMRRTIAAAMLASALGMGHCRRCRPDQKHDAGTVIRPDELDAQSVGRRDSTLSESVLRDDGVTADSLSVEGLFRSFHLLAGPSN